jgi:hypothetical protein
MSTEYVQVIGITSTTITVSNTVTTTSVFLQEITGGSLSTHNRLRWQMAGEISFNAQNDQCTVGMYYGGVEVASCIVKNSAAGARLNKGLVIDAELSADGSADSQFGTIHSYLGLPRSEDGSTPVGFGTGGISSGGDEDFEIKVTWGSASASNSFVHQHSTLELISYVEDVPVDDLDDPTAYIFLNSALNDVRYDLRKYCYFYAPLLWELDFYGFGDVTFTRASGSTATWRDGASHTVAANVPRFEYSGDTVQGLAMNTASEALNYSSVNALHDSNTLAWCEDGVYKSTKRGDANPFNSSGTWVGNSGIHITHITKFNKVLTAAEDVEVEVALT